MRLANPILDVFVPLRRGGPPEYALRAFNSARTLAFEWSPANADWLVAYLRTDEQRAATVGDED